MKEDPGTPPTGELTPPLGVRLLWWIAIYLGAQLPLIGYAAFFTLFPTGLIGPFIQPFVPTPNVTAYVPYQRYWTSVVILSYAFYLIHFLLTLVIRTPRGFRILRTILIVAVVLNLIGCSIAVDFHFKP